MALVWTGIILFFCLIKATDVPQVNVQYLDKCVHIVFHFLFTILWFLYFKKRTIKTRYNRLLQVAFISSVVFGIVIEILQELFTETRAADFLDVMANVAGALLAVGFIKMLHAYTRIV